MNVLHVTPSFYPAMVYGGPSYSVHSMCRSLVDHGETVRVLTTDANGPGRVLDVDTNHEVELSLRLWVRYCHRIGDVSISPELLRLLVPYIWKADIIHLMAVYSFPTIPTLGVCRILNKPIVWSPRGMLQRWNGTKRPHLKTVWDQVCRFVAPPGLVLHATSLEESRESASRLPGIRTVVIPNGVEIPKAVEHRKGTRARRLAFLGRIDPKKGLENLLEACTIIRKRQGASPVLMIAGTGDPTYVETIHARIRCLGLSPSVQMIGHVEGRAKTDFFQTSDILVVPSYTENFGLVVAEALAHCVPVIASKGTPWRRVEEVGCGFYVENDPETLASAIQKMCQMPLYEMGLRGREWMQREYSWDCVTQRMIEVYKSLAPGSA